MGGETARPSGSLRDMKQDDLPLVSQRGESSS